MFLRQKVYDSFFFSFKRLVASFFGRLFPGVPLRGDEFGVKWVFFRGGLTKKEFAKANICVREQQRQ